jgi:hypothetical protein
MGGIPLSNASLLLIIRKTGYIGSVYLVEGLWRPGYAKGTRTTVSIPDAKLELVLAGIGVVFGR